MIYNAFKDMKLSALGMGNMRLPVVDGNDAAIDEAATEAILDYCMTHGINYYDTAWGYHSGNSELVVGKLLQKYPRESFYLASKFPGYDLSNMGRVEEIFEEQLRKCRVGYFDFYLFHNVCEMNIEQYGNDFLQLLRRYTNLNYEYVGYNETWETMPELLRSGEIDMYTLALKNEETTQEFAFSQPIGRTYTEITVRTDDSRFQSGEYDGFNGMMIGTVKGYDFADNLALFAEEKRFSYNLRTYSTEDEMVAALMEGKVDGLVYGSMRKRPGERRIARFAPEDYYVAVRKEDTDLLDEVNYGIEQMDLNEGDWRNKFFYQYYSEMGISDGGLYFTQREKDYIAAVQSGEKTITACAQIDRNPYSWSEKGKMVGIIPEYLFLDCRTR